MTTVLSVVGTRPEAIKMAPVMAELSRRAGVFQSVVCVTGQHRQMLDQVLALFDIRPDLDLALMEPNQSLSRLTARLFENLSGTIDEVKPDWMLAQGDTTTVMVASMVAFYHGVRFGHVEAGLRTGNLRQPFPEEVNRRVADMVSTLCFAPTEQAKAALIQEGRSPETIHLTGNTVVDALLSVAGKPFDWSQSCLPQLDERARLVLVTAHRRENFGKPFQSICNAIRQIAIRHEGKHVHLVYPVHLNPNVRQPVQALLADVPNVHLIEPVDYFTMVHLMKRSCLILTDSGGVQEEAPSLGVPVLVMRETTERPEGVDAGLVRLVGTSEQTILEAASEVLENGSFVPAERRGWNPYGDGKAAERIVGILERIATGNGLEASHG